MSRFKTLNTRRLQELAGIPTSNILKESNSPGDKPYSREGQVLDFKHHKDRIIDGIKKVLDGENFPSARGMTVFYSVIRNSGSDRGRVGSSKTLGFTDEDVKDWKAFFSKSPWSYDGVWSQITFGTKSSRTHKNVTYNYYITLVSTKENFILFKNKVLDLAKKLQNLSDINNQAGIAFKTHPLLDAMVHDNDSLKVYYYDSKLKSDIEKTVTDWLSSSGIKFGKRSHTHGFDIKSENPDEDAKSWGVILDSILTRQLTDTIKQNGTKYTPEQYYKGIATYAPDIIKKAEAAYSKKYHI